MRLSPTPSRWFEAYVPREQVISATEVLARTGAVQLERGSQVAEKFDEGRLRYFVERFRALAAAHDRDLPGPGQQPTTLEGDPVHLANLALHRLRIWSARVDYLRARIAQLDASMQQLRLLDECLAAMERANLDLDRAFHQTQFLSKYLVVCPKGQLPAPVEGGALDTMIEGKEHDFVYIASLEEQRHPAAELPDGAGCEPLNIPAWLTRSRDRRREVLSLRRLEIKDERSELGAELKALRRDPDLARDHANIETLHWYLEHAAGHLTRDSHCHLSGWTTVTDVRELQRALAAARIKTIIRSPRAPTQLTAPVTTLDAWWARPFQPIIGLWGTPGQREVDPSALLALVVPLLFGYMFPDVGHGLILLGFALLYSWRRPQSRFLIPCSLAAIGFGFLVGDVFGFHGLLPAVWLRPLADPLPLLIVPMLFGMGLILVGMIFAGIEAHWRHELRPWLLIDGSVSLIYVSALLGWWQPHAFWLTAAAAIHYVLASTLLAPRGDRFAAVPQALVGLLLSVFELVMNTLSFIRVGAFALAHAALSQAIVTISESVENTLGKVLILVAGNLFAIVIEGLLVFVQTTRLVLFEFFIRFLHAEGRPFRPLGRPALPMAKPSRPSRR